MRNALVLILSCVAVLAFVACGSSSQGLIYIPEAGTGSPDSSVDDSGGVTDGGGKDAGTDGLNLGDASGCQAGCAADGLTVVGCDGMPIMTCSGGLVCGGGMCLSPCDAAAANKSTIGCDYYIVNPDLIHEGAGACFAAYVANTAPSPITITLEYNGQSIDTTNIAVVSSGDGKALTYQPIPNNQLPSGQVAIVFLSQFTSPTDAGSGDNACPIAPAVSADTAVHGTGMGNAFHLTTSLPVVAYDILPYGGGNAALTSATLLIPTGGWDTNYIAVNAFAQSQLAAQSGAQPSLDIVAMMDNTTVTINSPVDIEPGPGVAGGSAGTAQMYMLSKGQVLQFSQAAELTGSPIQSNNPIGVWGAASCLNVDVNTCCCDSAHQELPPVRALGSEYSLVRYRNRGDNGPDETPPWRLVGAVNGTQLFWSPSVPQGAPTGISLGQVFEFNGTGPYVVSSQDANHPFYVSGHMSGCETYFTTSDCRGDPEFVDIVPTAQWLSTYTFFTDPTYSETNLVVTRKRRVVTSGDAGTAATDSGTDSGTDGGAGTDAGGDGGVGTFADVSLDCAGVLTGWAPIDADDTYEYTRIDLVRHNFVPQGNCDNGRHQMTSSEPFALTVWGWGSAETGGTYGPGPPADSGFEIPGFYTQCVSYAYPAGMNLVPINDVVVSPTQ